MAKRLLDALQAARRIREFTAGLEVERFSASDLVRAAVERQFEIIGEALGRAAALDPQLETKLPDVPRIVGLRNRLIHGYDGVDDALVWDIVQTKIPPLQTSLRSILAENGFPTDG